MVDLRCGQSKRACRPPGHLDRTSTISVEFAVVWSGPGPHVGTGQIQRWNQIRESHSDLVSSTSVQIGQNHANAISASTV